MRAAELPWWCTMVFMEVVVARTVAPPLLREWSLRRGGAAAAAWWSVSGAAMEFWFACAAEMVQIPAKSAAAVVLRRSEEVRRRDGCSRSLLPWRRRCVAVRGAEKVAALRGGSSWWSYGADSGELTLEGAAMAEARGRRTRSMAAA